MREYGSQAVVWQTAINPVVALELSRAGRGGRRRARARGVRRGAVPRPADRLRVAVGDARGSSQRPVLRVCRSGASAAPAPRAALTLDIALQAGPPALTPIGGIATVTARLDVDGLDVALRRRLPRPTVMRPIGIKLGSPRDSPELSINRLKDWRLGDGRLPSGWRQLEAGEVERRRHDAADERPGPKRARGLPRAGGDDRLDDRPSGHVRTEPVHRDRAIALAPDAELERVPAGGLPDLVGIDAMPVRSLARREQKEDRAGRRPRPADRLRSPRLDVPAPSGCARSPSAATTSGPSIRQCHALLGQGRPDRRHRGCGPACARSHTAKVAPARGRDVPGWLDLAVARPTGGRPESGRAVGRGVDEPDIDLRPCPSSWRCRTGPDRSAPGRHRQRRPTEHPFPPTRHRWPPCAGRYRFELRLTVGSSATPWRGPSPSAAEPRRAAVHDHARLVLRRGRPTGRATPAGRYAQLPADVQRISRSCAATRSISTSRPPSSSSIRTPSTAAPSDTWRTTRAPGTRAAGSASSSAGGRDVFQFRTTTTFLEEPPNASVIAATLVPGRTGQTGATTARTMY